MILRSRYEILYASYHPGYMHSEEVHPMTPLVPCSCVLVVVHNTHLISTTTVALPQQQVRCFMYMLLLLLTDPRLNKACDARMQTPDSRL